MEATLSKTEKRLAAWRSVHALAHPLLVQAAADANALPGIDILYVSSPAEIGISTSLNAVILHYGNHPARGAPLRHDGAIAVEGGCALYIGQDADGVVFTYMTPFRTELAAPPEQVLLLNAFPTPSHLRAVYLQHNVATLHAYARVTQHNGKPMRGDKLRLRYVREHAEAVAHPGKALIRIVRLFLKVKSGAWGLGGFLGSHGLP